MKTLSSRFSTSLRKPHLSSFVETHCRVFSHSTPENPPPYRSSLLSGKFATSLDYCANIDSLRKLHACILVNGLERNTFLGFKLLNLYARFDLLTESRLVFKKVINNNLALWNSILVGYSRAGYHDEVIRIYVELRQRKIGIDSSAVTFSLRSCGELGDLEFGKIVHADTYKFGMNGGCFVGSSLIMFYSKYDEIEEAAKVFDEIIERDIVVYTSMVTGYAQAGNRWAFNAFRVVHCMQREELEPNRVTLVSLLQAASKLGALEEGKSIHGYAIRKGIGWLDEVFETSLMDMYMKCGLPDKAALAFSNMSRKTTGSWNALITAHLQYGRPLESLQHILQMIKENHVPDLITLANGLMSCAYLGNLAGGMCIHGYLLRNIQLDLVASTALIDMYSKCNRLIQAKEIFDQIESKDVISFNVMITGYLENGFVCEALEEFHQMVKMGFKPNAGTILNVLSALSILKDMRRCKCIHGYVFRNGLEANTEIANQFIYVYTNSYIVNYARQVFDRIQDKDTISWTSMISGLVNCGLADEAVTLFRLMQGGKVNPDSITFVILLQAFAQLGSIRLAREVHCHIYRVSLDEDISIINSLLTTYGKCGKLMMAKCLFEQLAKMNLATWNSMISAYGMHGDCIQALILFEQMKKDKVAPDELTFRSVLSACSHSGFVDEGLRVFRSMKEEYCIVPSYEHYGCVVDLLSRAGCLEEAYNLIKCVPSSENASVLRALLAACRVHGNTKMGEIIGRRLLNLEPRNPSAYNLMSNLYAEQEKWEQVAKIRGRGKETGLKSVTGHSLIEFG